MQDAKDFLMGGGAGPKSIFNKYDAVGTVRRITVESWKMQQQQDPKTKELKKWNDGNPMMQLVIVGSNFRDQNDTPLRSTEIEDDNGERRVFVKGDLKGKVQSAVVAAGEEFIGRKGILTVARTDKEPDQGVIDGAWIHQCHYQPPAQSFLASSTPAGGQAVAAPLNLAPAATAPAPDPVAAATANLAAAGMTSAPPAATGVAVSTAPPVAAAAPAGVDPALAAALANLTTEQRQAMGLPA